ncbi:MAG: hypothetical protein KGY74_09680, partial [Candidatus Cloacimonetes bacterium]|nr:hypothetical protein [Candidatus Cloacimonadota bacterium]
GNCWDETISFTGFKGCNVSGKTISYYDKSIVFLTIQVIEKIIKNTQTQASNDGQIILNKESLLALKNVFHEIGHAKKEYKFGKINVKEDADNYEEMLNELWKILRDEYIAEMSCAKLIEFSHSINWYGDFDDNLESENLIHYMSSYTEKGKKLNGAFVLQLLHQYYFVPLFKKAGFLKAALKILSENNIFACKTIKDINKCNVLENRYVPIIFNDIVLRKWNDFNLIEYVENL